MADITITELFAIASPASTDILAIVDLTADVTKKVTIADLLENAGDGTAAAPAFSFDSDNNTGVFLAAADKLGFSTNGVGRVYIDATGKVGIGTAAPSEALDVIGNAEISGTLDVTGATTFDSNVTVEGNLTVNGTTTTIDSTTLTVEDKNIEMGVATTPTDVTADGGGITLKGATDKTINWVNSTDAWTLSEHVNIASAKEYRINGTKVLDATSLGSAVVGSSLTSVGTITTGVWNGTPITKAYIADGMIVDADVSATAEIAVSKLANGTARQLLQTDAAGTGVEFTSNVDVPGTLDVSSTAVFDGNVGIRTTTPQVPLEVYRGATEGPTLRLSGNTDGNSRSLTFSTETADGGSGALHRATIASIAGTFAFSNNAGEKVRIDSNGRLLVGLSSGRDNYFLGSTAINPQLQLESTGGADTSFGITRNTNTGGAPSIYLGKTRGSAVGQNTIVQSSDRLGTLSFNGADGTNLIQAAKISAFVDGTPGANDMPGRLTFFTTADGASSPTERVHIDRNGAVRIGAADGVGLLNVGTNNNDPVANNAGGICIRNQGHILSNTQTTGAISSFRRDGDGALITFHNNSSTVRGSISVAGSTTAYNTSSDYRLKENIVDLIGAADRVNQLQVHRFNFIANPETTVDGFLAHEAQAVVPECVTGTKDEVDDEGNPVYQGIDQSKIVPLLTAALQEALAKIETLEQRLTDAGL